MLRRPLELTARADRTSGARSTLRALIKHPPLARTTCEAARRCPKPPRGANAPAAALRNNPRTTTGPAPAATCAREQAPRLHRWSSTRPGTVAGPQIQKLDKRLHV